MADRVRVQKAIANAGLMSRRAAEEAITDKRVRIDGEEAVLGDRVDVDTQVVTLDDIPIPINPDLETYLVYKPTGVISTASDPQGRPTVLGLIDSDKRIYPVGRLDVDSEGLLLLTNDGELANRVMHPRYGITKTYVAQVEGQPGKAAIRRLSEGVVLEDGEAKAISARIVEQSRSSTLVEVVMGEGRKREVRRMFDQIGFPVARLVRVAIGPIKDQSLRAGESRLLAPSEVASLLRSGRDD